MRMRALASQARYRAYRGNDSRTGSPNEAAPAG